MLISRELELYPGQIVTQLLFKCVRNAKSLRRSAMEGKINAALINPKMLVDHFQVVVAANKAVHLQKIGKMKTRSLYSEIIFNLSPTNNISEAFKRFGLSDDDDLVLVVLVHSKDESLTDVMGHVEGQQIPVEELSTLSDTDQIKKLYKVTQHEEKVGTLLDSVVCKMATKDVM